MKKTLLKQALYPVYINSLYLEKICFLDEYFVCGVIKNLFNIY